MRFATKLERKWLVHLLTALVLLCTAALLAGCGRTTLVSCGDGRCSDVESCESCPVDCCAPECGDGVCAEDRNH